MSARYLNFEDRKKIGTLYDSGAKISDIAKALGVSQATIYRELKRGAVRELDRNGRIGYSAERGQTTLNESYRTRTARKTV